MTSRQPTSPAKIPAAARRPGRKIAAGGALAFLVAGAVLAGGAQWTAHEVRGALAGIGVEVAEVSVDPVSGVVTLDGVTASQNDVKIRIGSVASTGHFALASPAEAASPVTLTDIEISSKTLTLRIPRLEVAGDNVNEAQLRAIFDKSSKAPLAQRLSEISVSRATIPELVIVQKSDKVETRSTWSQVIITDLKNGMAGAISSTGATFSSKTGDNDATGSAGAANMEKVNLALLARLYTEAAANDADRQLQPAYGAFSASDLTVKSEDANFFIKNVSGTGFKARMLRAPLLDILAEIETVKDPSDLEPKARAAYFNNVADLMEAFEFGQATVTGVRFDVASQADDEEDDAEEATDGGKKEIGKADSGDTEGDRVRGEIASFTFGSDPASGGFKFSGLKLVPAEGDLVSLAEARLGGFGPSTMVKMFRDQAKAAEAGKDADDLSSLAFAGDFSLNNLAVNLANDDKPNERIKFTLQSYVGSYQDPVDGVPTNIKTSLDHLVIDLPDMKASADDGNDEDEDSSLNDSVRKLRDMGYDKLDLSAKIDGKWDAAKKELRIGELSFGGVNIGGVKLTGLLGNVSRELFTTGADGAQQALMAAHLKNLTLGVSDNGFAQRFADLQAKDQGSDGVTVRTGWAALAQMLLPSMIGTSEGAKVLTSSLGDFIRKSGALDISVSSRNPEGDVIGELAASALSGSPDKLFQQIDVKATAK